MNIDDKLLAEYTMAMLHKLYVLYAEGTISYETYLKNIELKIMFLNEYYASKNGFSSINYSYSVQ